MRAVLSELFDPKVHARVRARYRQDWETLVRLGFRPVSYYHEQLGPFSAIYALPMLVLMAVKREVIAIRAPLRIGAAYVLLANSDPSTIALPMGLGIKFYSGFDTGETLITCTFPSQAAPRSGFGVTKTPSTTEIDGAWRLHQAQIQQFEAEGATLRPAASFSHYLAFSDKEQDSL